MFSRQQAHLAIFALALLCRVVSEHYRQDQTSREYRRVLELKPDDADAASHLRRLLEDQQ